MDLANAYLGLRAELASILERLEAAQQAAHSARVYREQGQAAAAEAESEQAAADFHAASRAIADLFLLLLRHTLTHCRDALRQYLLGLLEPELSELGDSIARAERRGK